jgi:hypothetical protein
MVLPACQFFASAITDQGKLNAPESALTVKPWQQGSMTSGGRESFQQTLIKNSI